MRGGCRRCGAVEVVVVDDGGFLWVECGECGKTAVGYAREDAPFALQAVAEPLDDEELA